MKDCKEYFIKVKKQDVVFYAPFFEAYQGMLSLRTPKPPEGEIATLQVIVSPDFTEEFEALLKHMNLKAEES